MSEVVSNSFLECHLEHLYAKINLTKVLLISVFLDALMNLFFQIKLYFLRVIRLSWFLRLRSVWSLKVDPSSFVKAKWFLFDILVISVFISLSIGLNSVKKFLFSVISSSTFWTGLVKKIHHLLHIRHWKAINHLVLRSNCVPYSDKKFQWGVSKQGLKKVKNFVKKNHPVVHLYSCWISVHFFFQFSHSP